MSELTSGIPPLDGPGEKVDSCLDAISKEDFATYERVMEQLLNTAHSSPRLAERFQELGYQVSERTIRAWRQARLEYLVNPADTLPQLERPVHPSPSRDIEIARSEASVTVTAPKGEATVGKARDYLKAQGQDPDAWVVSRFQGSERELSSGQVLESNRWTFVPADQSAGSTDEPLIDLDDLHAFVQRTGGDVAPEEMAPSSGGVTVAVDIADPQWGKVDYRGGAEDTLARIERSLAKFKRWVREVLPDEIVVMDGGDGLEGFESVASEERTNDLELTEQLRLHRRVQFMWIDAAAKLGVPVKYMSVGSNHCRVRRGKNNMGTPRDDYGIEVASQLKDMCEVAPERYGHVEFYVPEKHEESLALTLVGGKTLGLIHGHQTRKPEGIPAFLNGQAAGETPIGLADIAIFNHFHHFRTGPWGNGRVYFIAPTSDNGSSWYKNVSGQESGTGVLGLVIDADGWRPDGLRIL